MYNGKRKNAFLSIVIPIFNEERILSKTVEELTEYLINNSNPIEVIFINDNSTDASLEMLKNKLCSIQDKQIKIVNNTVRKGKALSVKDGIMLANGEYVIFMDADLSVPLKAMDKVVQYIDENNADIIIGSRNTEDKTTVIIRPYYRKLISKVYNKVCNILFFKNKIADVGCGFKVFRREVAKSLFLNLYIKSWIFDVEVIAGALKKNYKIKQMPVDWIFKGHSHLNIYRDLIVACCELFKLKLHILKNRI